MATRLPTQIKVCGVTTVADVALCVQCGANAIGFNLWPRSPRSVSESLAAELINELPVTVRPVLVVVNPSEAEVARYRREFSERVWIQLHGDESPEFVKKVGDRVTKAFATTPDIIERLGAYPTAEVLLDASVEGERGGTGQVADWELVRQVAKARRTWLSGGLTSGNVAKAIQACGPFGVDVASGVERSPGHKDPEKIRAFVEAVRKVDSRAAGNSGSA